jgi:SPP1 gp7 family putative phage head morphogenesis protein
VKRNPTKTTPIIISYGRELKGLISNFQNKALTVIPRMQREYGVQFKQLQKLKKELAEKSIVTNKKPVLSDIDILECEEIEKNIKKIENSLVSEIDRIIAELEHQEIQSKLRSIVRRYTGQTYTKGAQKAVADLRRARYEISFAYTPSDLKAVEMMIDHNLIEIKGLEEYLKKEVMRVLSTGMLEGRSNDKIARDLVDRVGIVKDRAMMTARTETIRSYNQASIERYKSAGLTQWRWISAMDERICPECESLDNKIFDFGEEQPPLHPNCLLPGTRYKSPGGIIMGLRTWYDGIVMEIVFSKGSRLTVTPNHMLFTPNGFAAANLLREGDDVFYCPGFEGIIDSDQDDNDVPSVVEEIFESLRLTPGMVSMSMPTSAEYLHGDGRFVNSHIDIVAPDRFLRSTSKSFSPELISKDKFSTTYPITHTLTGLSGFAKTLLSWATAADGIMSGRRQSSAFFRGRLAHPEIHGFTSIPLNDTSIMESSDNTVPINKKSFREFFDGHTGIIQRNEGVNIDIFPNVPNLDTGRFQSSFNGSSFGLENFSDIADGFSRIIKRGNSFGDNIGASPRSSCFDSCGLQTTCHKSRTYSKNFTNVNACFSPFIQTDNISSINLRSYHGYVYDFQTITTLSICNSIVCSNCRCATAPYIDENLTPSPEE